VADQPTLAVYEARAAEWEAVRDSGLKGAMSWAVTLAGEDRPVLDVGCGPGWQLPAFGPGAIGLDAAGAFIARIGVNAPEALALRADLGALPLRAGSIGAAWANRSYVHVARRDLPLALWDLHRVLRVGAPVRLVLFDGDAELDGYPDDDFPGRRFSGWETEHLRDVVEGAGFTDVTVSTSHGSHVVDARRGFRLADTVGPAMDVLIVGLNPSPLTAERGIGFVRPGNRFWPAAIASGLVSRDRDPLHALRHHRIGMTNLAPRPTRAAAELTRREYREGGARLERLVRWLEPGVVCVVGITGWRAAIDSTASVGLQPVPFGGSQVFVMHNPSGLNAHATVESLTADFDEVRSIGRAARAGRQTAGDD